MQSKRQSLKETMANTGIGMIGSWLITMISFHLIDQITIASTVATVGCTVWSICRGYTVRRYFNKQQEKAND